MSRKSDLIGILETYNQSLNEMLGVSEPTSSPSFAAAKDVQPTPTNLQINSEDEETLHHNHVEKNIDMAKSEVFKIIKNSNDLLNLLSGTEKMEPWMLSKIVLACDYICSVKSVLEYEDFENYCKETQDGLDEVGSGMLVVSKIKDMLHGEDIQVNEEVLKTTIYNIEKLKK
jgi:hypothetical protein